MATVTPDGDPWNSPVHATCDDEFNIYWNSTIEAVHSTNIRANGKAFITLFDSTFVEGENTRGIYFRCDARELSDFDEIVAARELMRDKDGGQTNPAPERYIGDAPRRVYVARPLEAWVNNLYFDGPHWRDRREPVAVSDLRADIALRQNP